MKVVGPHCSRPVHLRHIAQALHFDPLAGLRAFGAFGEMSNLHKFLVLRRCISGLRQPPGELPRAAKRCLTPEGDEKCLALLRVTLSPVWKRISVKAPT